MVVIKSKKIGDTDVLENTYVCNYCSYTFTMRVRKSSTAHQKQTASTQVKCPQCGNFNKTYE